jgi:hypothetical protein
MADYNEEYRETQLALMQQIRVQAESAASAIAVLQLAEAFAWLTRPGQPHGGSTQQAAR